MSADAVAIDDSVVATDAQVATAVSDHSSDTTSVHGIADTSTLYRSGGTDVAVADGGTGASTAADARTNLGLVIGTNVQAYDGELAALAGLTSAADSLPYFTGSGTAALTTLSAFIRTLLDDADQGTARATLGVGTTDSPQFAGVNIGAATDTTITRTGAGDVAVEGNAIYRAGGTDVPVADGGTGSSTAAGARTNLDVPSNAEAVLDSIVDAKGDLIVGTAADTVARRAVGSDGQVLTADAAETTGVKWATPSTSSFTDHGFVTALPGSPGSGDVCVLVDSTTAPTYRWQLKYNGSSSSSYKWEVVGGTPMAARDDDQRSSTSASYVDVPTDQISLTTPLAGDWDLTIEGVPQTTGAWTAHHSYAVGATAASDTWGIHAGTGGGSIDISSSKRTRHTGLAASTVVKEQIRTTSAGNPAYTSHRRLWAMPVRVG